MEPFITGILIGVAIGVLIGCLVGCLAGVVLDQEIKHLHDSRPQIFDRRRDQA